MWVEIESMIEPTRQRPSHPQQPNCKSMQTLNMKSEADRRKTYKDWHVSFMDKSHLACCWILQHKLERYSLLRILWIGSGALEKRGQRSRRPSAFQSIL